MLIHGDSHLVNSTYPERFRKRIESCVRERGIELILGDYIDNIPESGTVGVVTRKGVKLADADLVVRFYLSYFSC